MATHARRVAVVTGAARGIGAATAKRLARDGHAVALLDLDAESCADVSAEIESEGGQALPLAVDVTDEDSVSNAVARIVDELGKPVVLVNNAGITRDNLLFRMTTSDWQEVMDVHLRGPFLMCRAVQEFMRQAEFGRIINLSSGAALGNRGQANYSAAKAGIQGFTKTLAIELGKFGVTANVVAPGFIETDMTAATADRMNMPFETLMENAAALTAVGRVGQPDDIAHAISFLASVGAGFVTGQVLYVSGGPIS